VYKELVIRQFNKMFLIHENLLTDEGFDITGRIKIPELQNNLTFFILYFLNQEFFLLAEEVKIYIS
jgi:hypothetical protein